MEKISAVIITLNEEKNIERCLLSLQGIADEVIVVDSFSTDRTAEICKKYNVNFIQQKWLGYAEQKNFGNSLASFNLILSLDADEALSEELKNSILEIKNTTPANTAFCINRLTNYCGKWLYHCGWYPDAKIRLFNKSTTRWKNLQIHEEIEFTEKTAVIHLKGNILHYSYYTIQDHIKQADKFTNLTAQEAFNKGKRISFIMLIIKPWWKFVRDYFLKAGFLDGYYGYVVCKTSAFATFLKYTKLRQLHKENEGK